MAAAAARWALEAAAQPADASAAIAGEFEDEQNSRIVQAAAAAAAPPLLFGENYLGLDDLPTPAAAQAAAAGAAAAHYAIARYFISQCVVGQEDAVFPFVAGGGRQGQDDGEEMGAMKFRGKIRGEEGSACKMVIVHLMCCGCIMSASAMVSSPSIVALFARWGGVRWLSDVVHVCVQCLLAVEEKLKKLAPPPSRSATASSASAPSSSLSSSSSSSSAAAASLSVLRLIESMRARLRVIFEYLQAEAHLLQQRPELALQQLQHSAGALAEVSSLHSAAARIIHDEAREELEAEGRGSAAAVQGRQVSQAASAGGSPRFDRTGHAVPELGPAGSSRLSASPSSSAAAAASAPPLLMLRSYSRPKHNRTRYLCVEYRIWACFSPNLP
jgi:hypothetical protein